MLVLIRNYGCDDTTTGLAQFNTEEELEKFIKIINDLNENSTYGCMPSIGLYEINQEDIVKLSLAETEVEEKDILYLDGEKYILAYKDEWDDIYNYEKDENDLNKKYLIEKGF